MMATETKLSIHIKIKFGDILHANRLFRASTSNDDVVRMLVGFMSLLIGLYEGIFLATQPTQALNNVDMSFPVAFVLILVGIILIFDLIPTVLGWITFRQNHRWYSEPYVVIFDETGMFIERQSANAKYGWNFFNVVVEGRDEFILIYGKNLYICIPKSSFQNKNDEEKFRSMLKSKFTTFKQKLKIPMDIRWKIAT